MKCANVAFSVVPRISAGDAYMKEYHKIHSCFLFNEPYPYSVSHGILFVIG